MKDIDESVVYASGQSAALHMTLSHRYLCAKLDLLEGFGFSKDRALSHLRLTEQALSRHQDRLEIDDFCALLTAASKALGDPDLALRLGHRFRIATFAQTGTVYGYCENIAQVIRMNARYQCLAIDAGQIAYVNRDGQHFMRFSPYYTDQSAYRPITDIIMGAYATAYRWLSWGSGEELVEMHMPYPAPPSTKLHEAFFQCPIDFGMEAGCLRFPDAAMAQPLPTRDPQKLIQTRVKLDRLLGARRQAKSLDGQVEAAICVALRSGRSNAACVAQEMGLEPKDLRAILKASGRGYRERLKGVRQQMFDDLLDADESLSRISQALGYNDQSALNRAVNVWYDMRPGEYAARRKADQRATPQ
jgi:AraC-like DNA-binding protein